MSQDTRIRVEKYKYSCRCLYNYKNWSMLNMLQVHMDAFFPLNLEEQFCPKN